MRTLERINRIVLACLACLVADHAGAQVSKGSTPPAVQIAPIKLAPVTQQVTYVGTVMAIQQVALRAQVEGYLSSVQFVEGSFLNAGSPAFQIEKAPFQAILDGANAMLASAQASEAGSEADLKQAQLTLTRQLELLRANATSQANVDQATASRDSSTAKMKQSQAQVAQAQSQVQTAELNLSYTDVQSPISGRVGKAQITAGNLVSASTGTLATVVQTDPIRVAFSISDFGYLTIVNELQPNSQGVPSKTTSFLPRLKLSDGSVYVHSGKIAFIDNAVDPSTGTIAVYADFPNPNLQLLPGQYVDVTVETGSPQQLPIVPAVAVQQDQDGSYVFVLDEANRAVIRRIKTGVRVGVDWAVPSGLANGDVVIVSGIQKVRAGIIVNPQPAPSGS